MSEREERMLKWFEFEHLPNHLKEMSQPFHALAEYVISCADHPASVARKGRLPKGPSRLRRDFFVE